MTITHAAVRPRHARIIAVLAASAAAVLALTLAQPISAEAAGTPTGPQYDYRMISVSKTGTRVKSEAISAITCQTSGTGTAGYSTSSTLSNSFSVSGGLDFGKLAGLLSGSISVSGGVTTSTTVTESLSTNITAPQCVRVFALRDNYRYTLQKKCNYACVGAYANKTWVTQGTGTYTKFVGRAFYLV